MNSSTQFHDDWASFLNPALFLDPLDFSSTSSNTTRAPSSFASDLYDYVLPLELNTLPIDSPSPSASSSLSSAASSEPSTPPHQHMTALCAPSALPVCSVGSPKARNPFLTRSSSSSSNSPSMAATLPIGLPPPRKISKDEARELKKMLQREQKKFRVGKAVKPSKARHSPLLKVPSTSFIAPAVPNYQQEKSVWLEKLREAELRAINLRSTTNST